MGTRPIVLRSRITIIGFIVAVAVCSIATLSVGITRISGNSMVPTLCDGDLVITWSTAARAFNVGEVVIFRIDSGTPAVKRIVALGQTSVRTDADQAIVSGRVLQEPYACLNGFPNARTRMEHGLAWRRQVPLNLGEAFVMGDNRASSVDSRDFGAIQLRHVESKVLFRVPLGRANPRCVCLAALPR